jgi:hypothetical protein
MKSAANPRFWKRYADLPPEIQRLARKNYLLWKRDPRRPSLRFEKKGKVWAARVGDHFRALAQQRGDTFYWFWIGAHDEYEQLIKR